MDELPPEAMARTMQNAAAFGPGGRFLAEVFAPFDFRGIAHTPPTETFDGELRLRVGTKEVVLLEVGPAHTKGDVIVWLPQERVVFTGEQPQPHTPLLLERQVISRMVGEVRRRFLMGLGERDP